MSVQSKFLKFNDKIAADFGTKKELSEKRDILIYKLRNSNELPSFKEFNQGSYAMFTGVVPEDGEEYDIDVALRFNANKSDYNPIDIKEKIYNILKDHTDYGAEIKKPCVTVRYTKNGEIKYHVDLVIYLYDDKNNEESQMYIAKGKDEDFQEWEKADPKGLLNYINEKIEIEEERSQFRRVVRYLKKWKNRKFSNTGNVNPPSIGITLLTVDNFSYYQDNDLDALISIVEKIIDKFILVDYSDNFRKLYRINLSLPSMLKFEFGIDIFKKMTDIQMTDFKDKLEKLKKDLLDVREEVDEFEKYRKLNKIFGDDFELQEEENFAKKQINYVPNSSASGME